MSNKKEKTILALGADMKNKFLVANGKTLSFGPDIGDLSDAGNHEFFKRELCRAVKKLKPDVIACDLHPGYFSSQFAKEHSLQLKAYSLQPVQHHHAHIASVVEEHSLKGPVIGVSFDGTGFGTDGNMWGGEFLLVGKKGVKRLAHLKYYKMPGGEKAVSEPWRMALSILGEKGIPFLKGVKREEKEAILMMCRKDINSPLTSSAGRLFDAAAALLGICLRASYEAEGPIKLEAMCRVGIEEAYAFRTLKREGAYVIDAEPIFLNMLKDIRKGVEKSVIATKFHNSMANVIVDTVKTLSKNKRINKIALSGGVFQNKFLKTKVIEKLQSEKLKVFTNEKLPVSDLNISLGQYHVSCASGKN